MLFDEPNNSQISILEKLLHRFVFVINIIISDLRKTALIKKTS